MVSRKAVEGIQEKQRNKKKKFKENMVGGGQNFGETKLMKHLHEWYRKYKICPNIK